MKILILHKRLLFPANTGGKIRTLNIVRHLAKWHDVTCVCNVLADEEDYLQQMRDLGVRLIAIPWNEPPRDSWRFYWGLAGNLASVYPYSANKDFDRRLRSKLSDLLEHEAFELLICDFVQTSRNVIGLDSIPKLLFQHNVEAEIYRRLANNESNWPKRWFIRIQQRKMEFFEARAGNAFQKIVAVSHKDAAMFLKHYTWKHVAVIDTAVDIEYFTPLAGDKIRGKLVFVGSMDWLPNQEGMLRFVHNILPRIQQYHPHVTLDIAGRNPSCSIRRLSEHAGVTVTDSVDDVRPFIARAEIAVIPMYAGGGTRLKMFEFMAMRTPVVSTSLGAEGLNIRAGEHWVQADSDRDFAEAVGRLLDDQTRREQLAEAAFRLVRRNYGSEAVARQFERICVATTCDRSPVRMS